MHKLDLSSQSPLRTRQTWRHNPTQTTYSALGDINYFTSLQQTCIYHTTQRLHTNTDKTLVNSLHGLLNCGISGLDCHVITPEYRTRVHCIHM